LLRWCEGACRKRLRSGSARCSGASSTISKS
jgi:hypothetical protein